jgi:hypothetical protein
MKKYTFEADRYPHEKPLEPKHIFTPPASIAVTAENEAEAIKKAEAGLNKAYYGSGILLGDIRLAKTDDLPVDWNYGYGENRVYGNDIRDKIGPSQIR